MTPIIPRQIQVTDETEAIEIWGEIMDGRMEGYIYRDGEVWADEAELMRYRVHKIISEETGFSIDAISGKALEKYNADIEAFSKLMTVER